jgi:hypothetical protein
MRKQAVGRQRIGCMSAKDFNGRPSREARFLKVIAHYAPSIPPATLRKQLALHVLVFRGRTLEELEHMAKHGYFAEGTPEQRQRESVFSREYQGP